VHEGEIMGLARQKVTMPARHGAQSSANAVTEVDFWSRGLILARDVVLAVALAVIKQSAAPSFGA